MSSTLYPQKAAVAGLVPCALSGTRTTERMSPRASSAERIASKPHSSPCAPAFGLMATAAMPVSVFSHFASSSITASAPCTVATGCRGWISAKPGKRATFSLRRGLCFMVQRSEEHTSELQSLMRISYAVFCLKKKKHKKTITNTDYYHKQGHTPHTKYKQHRSRHKLKYT